MMWIAMDHSALPKVGLLPRRCRGLPHLRLRRHQEHRARDHPRPLRTARRCGRLVGFSCITLLYSTRVTERQLTVAVFALVFMCC